MGQPELVNELLIGRRLLQRVEVLAVKVLDQRLLEAGDVPGVGLYEYRDGLQPGAACGAPAALPGDQLVALLFTVDFAHQHRLEESHFTN